MTRTPAENARLARFAKEYEVSQNETVLAVERAVEWVEERAPEFAQLNAKGNGVGAIMNMQTQFHLTEAGTGTSMRWEADVKIAGPVGAMGQRVLQPIINQQVGNVLGALEKQVSEAAAGGAAAEQQS